MKSYWVYILSNNTGTLYVGVTGNLNLRIQQHKLKVIKGFTQRYNITRLVYFEEFSQIKDAINAEKMLKGWTRIKKLNLIKSINPNLEDLFSPADPSATLQDDNN